MEAPRGERCESCVEAYQDRRRLGAAVGWAVALTTPAARRRRCRLQRQRRPDSAVRVTSGERQVVLLCVCPPNEVQTRRSLRVFVIAVRVCRGMRGYVLSPRLPYPRRLAVSRARRTVPRRTVPRATARGVHTVHGVRYSIYSRNSFSDRVGRVRREHRNRGGANRGNLSRVASCKSESPLRRDAPSPASRCGESRVEVTGHVSACGSTQDPIEYQDGSAPRIRALERRLDLTKRAIRTACSHDRIGARAEATRYGAHLREAIVAATRRGWKWHLQSRVGFLAPLGSTGRHATHTLTERRRSR